MYKYLHEIFGQDLGCQLPFLIQGQPFRQDPKMVPARLLESLPRLSRFVRQGYTTRPNAPQPNILMVHDSFYKRLKPYLSNQFSRVLYIWDWGLNFYPHIIKKESPKLVIDEMAERFLLTKIPTNPPSLVID